MSDTVDDRTTALRLIRKLVDSREASIKPGPLTDLSLDELDLLYEVAGDLYEP